MYLGYTQQEIDTLSAASGDKIVNKELLGFVVVDCDIIKNNILGIMRVTVKEENIFDDNRKIALNSIFNKLAYDF